jgi:hypothetical protein
MKARIAVLICLQIEPFILVFASSLFNFNLFLGASIFDLKGIVNSYDDVLCSHYKLLILVLYH